MKAPSLSFDILKSRNFRVLLITRLAVSMALQAQAVIVGWQIYAMTKDAFLLGLVGLAEAIPALACALVAGHIVDHASPKKIYRLCLSSLFLNTALLLAVAGGFTPLSASSVTFYIFFGVFVSGIARAFIMPASFSLLPLVVERPAMSSASAWLTSGFQIAAVTGPAAAGLIYGFLGGQMAWLMPVLLMALASISVGFLTVQEKPLPEKREAAVKSIIEGWRFILQNPVLLSVMALDMFAVLFGGAVAMLPAFAAEILHVGSEGLGALRAAPAVGAVLMGLMLAMNPMRVLSARRLLLVVAGFGLCIIGFGLSKSFGLSLFFLGLSGAFDGVSMVIRGTIMQLKTPDRMRGRVSSVNAMFIISSNEIGAFESGLAARLLGLTPSVVFGGAMTLLVAVATASLSAKFRNTVIHTDDINP